MLFSFSFFPLHAMTWSLNRTKCENGQIAFYAAKWHGKSDLHPIVVISILILNKREDFIVALSGEHFHSTENSTQFIHCDELEKPVVICMRNACSTRCLPPLQAFSKHMKSHSECMSQGRKYELPSYFRTIEWHCCDNDWIYDKHSQCIMPTVNIICKNTAPNRFLLCSK